MSQNKQWAVLLCRYKDDQNDPNLVSIKDLGTQFLASFPGPDWLTSAGWQTDTTTILQKYQLFFTAAGSQTANMPNFFRLVSHSTIDLDDTEIFPCVLDRTKAEAAALAAGANTGGSKYQNETFHLAKKALQEQWSVHPSSFYALVVSFQWPDFGSQGGNYDGGPGVFMDVRYVVNNGSKRWGHEMGHAFGLDHSRADTTDPNFNPVGCLSGPPDYRDPWDTMSAECSFGVFDQDYGAKGPGYNAWNMRGRRWLDEARIWHCPAEIFSQILTLRPLHRLDLAGYLAAEIPPYRSIGNFPRYLVEFRLKKDWDAGIPRSCVLVHHEEGKIEQFLGTHSYVELAEGGNADMVVGDIFYENSGEQPSPQVRVLEINEEDESAQVHISYLPPFSQICAARNQDGRIEVFAIAADASIHHFWQTVPNGTWTAEMPRIGAKDKASFITMILNENSQLEIFYVGTDSHLYHNWQIALNGNWHGEKRINDNYKAKQIAVGNNADGRLQMFYRGTNDRLYYDVKNTTSGWIGQKELGDLVQTIAVGSNQNKSFELCYIGQDGQLRRRRQQAPADYDSWSAASPLGDAAKEFAICACADQQLEIVYVNAANQLCHMFQTTPNGNWNTPRELQRFAKNLAVTMNSSGVLEMFFTDAGDTLFHYQQTQPHVWEEDAQEFLGAGEQLVLIPNQDRHLEVIYIGTDSALYHNWQIGSSNNWNGELPF